MIQRIQTIWLLVASACAFLTLKFSFYTGTKTMENAPNQWVELNGQANLLITILTVAVGLASLILVFLYKERKRQITFTLVTLLLSVVNIVIYIAETGKFVNGAYALTAALTFLIPVFLLMAVRGIYKDEKLVKSVDRLR
ncbi:glucan phosphoethanolaminetransferase (alkaline phosphatase superfamily) [Filimonas zeae]|nr:DUF4293 domain-containing protein [Filimonas zeae]MDR6341986.1 glucan phosphoethanolaminetransferase (alkaline phosphatase superfamily) [Filimonas zeae]